MTTLSRTALLLFIWFGHAAFYETPGTFDHGLAVTLTMACGLAFIALPQRGQP